MNHAHSPFPITLARSIIELQFFKHKHCIGKEWWQVKTQINIIETIELDAKKRGQCTIRYYSSYSKRIVTVIAFRIYSANSFLY